MKSMGRIPCSRQVKFKRGSWTPEEDLCLTNYIQAHGEGRWTSLSKKSGLLRSGKSCRLRWINYLCPDVNRGHILPDEEDLILRLHRLLGNRWSLIAGRLPGRTDNDIKNYWNSHLSKKLISQGIDPRTHRPLSESEDIWWIPQDSDVQENTTSQEKTNPDINDKDSKHDQINCSSMAAAEIYCSQSVPNAEEVPSVEMRKSNWCENLKQISDGSWFPHSFPPTPMGTSYANGSSYNMYSSFLESLLNEDLEMPEPSVGYNSVSQQSELASPGYEFFSALQSPTIHYHRSH